MRGCLVREGSTSTGHRRQHRRSDEALAPGGPPLAVPDRPTASAEPGEGPPDGPIEVVEHSSARHVRVALAPGRSRPRPDPRSPAASFPGQLAPGSSHSMRKNVLYSASDRADLRAGGARRQRPAPRSSRPRRPGPCPPVPRPTPTDDPISRPPISTASVRPASPSGQHQGPGTMSRADLPGVGGPGRIPGTRSLLRDRPSEEVDGPISVTA
jgi:hypothetical protein